MPAATPPPKPCLEDILTILSRCELGASFASPDSSEITLNLRFKKAHLGPAGIYVFDWPSLLLATIRELLAADEAMEKAFRAQSPRNTIEDVIGYLTLKHSQISGLNGLSDRIDAAMFGSALQYLRELDRRRREIDRRAAADTEARRKSAEDEIRRRVEEEIRRREEEQRKAKEEANRRWAEEEAKKRKWQQNKTSDSGKSPPPGGSSFYDAYSSVFEEFARAYNRTNHRRFYDFDYDSPPPPPPSGGKRKWFEILQCSPNATRDEIRRAARQAAKGLHPDIPGQDTPENQRRIREITEAKAEGLSGCM